MVQRVMLDHPDVSGRIVCNPGADWHPRTRMFYFLGCVIGSWLLVAAPLLLIG